MISEAARDRFDAMIRAAVDAGARVLTGGRSAAGPRLVLSADGAPGRRHPGPNRRWPARSARSFWSGGSPTPTRRSPPPTPARYGLAASVWGRDLRAARSVAGGSRPGMVAINEAVTPTAHASAPFGGMKASGFGRTHGVLGLREFTQPQTTSTSGAPAASAPSSSPTRPGSNGRSRSIVASSTLAPDGLGPCRWSVMRPSTTIQDIWPGGRPTRRGLEGTEGTTECIPHGEVATAEDGSRRPLPGRVGFETARDHRGGCRGLRRTLHARPPRLPARWPGQTRPIRAFDATAPEILLVPAIQGG